MTSCDAHLQSILDDFGINGAVVAVGYDGRMIYNRAFGYADLAGNEPLQPSHLFRIASLSKAITSAAIFTLVEDGELQLSDHVFGPQGLLHDHPYLGNVVYTDMRIDDITVLQLLQHTAGWDRDINCFPNPTPPYNGFATGCDPIAAPLYVTQTLGESNPVSENALIHFLMEHGLDHDPGTTFAYSNIGYLVLGAIIEHITGMAYDDYVQSTIFDPIGICDIHLGNNLLSDKLEREVEYELEGYGQLLSCYGTGEMVPFPYGAFNVEAMDAHGGWVATASDLLKLLMAIDGQASKPDILQPGSITTMTTPSAANPNYACGWGVVPGMWWHTGSLPGTCTDMVIQDNGYSWVILINGQSTPALNNALWNAIENTGVECGDAPGGFPAHDLLVMPNANATNVTAVPSGPFSMDISCTAGDGDGRVIVVRETGMPQAFQVDGTAYVANADFPAGDDLGSGNHVVSAGTATSVSVQGLQPGTDYSVSIFEYDQRAETGQHVVYKFCGRSDAATSTSVGISTQVQEGQPFTVQVIDGHVLVQLNGYAGMGLLQIRDAAGRLVGERELPRSPRLVDLGRHATGVYTVSLSGAGQAPSVQRIGIVQ